LKVLVACEYSGVVRRAFRLKGHEAFSCDILPSEDNSQYHIQDDVRPLLSQSWDMLIAHPPCTALTVSGNRYYAHRQDLIQEALEFVLLFANANVPKIAIENPVGRLSTLWRKPDQYIQPWQFGHDASKKTGLWLKGLPKLQPTDVILKDRYANQTPSGQNNLGPSEDRAKIRSRTYEGIAAAMADQWSDYVQR